MIVRFTENVLEKLLKLNKFALNESTNDSNVVLLKIMHIAIVFHSPEPISGGESCEVGNSVNTNDVLLKRNVAENEQLWHKILRKMFHVIEREITECRKSKRLNLTPAISPTFVRVAAKLCSVVCILHAHLFSVSGNYLNNQ